MTSAEPRVRRSAVAQAVAGTPLADALQLAIGHLRAERIEPAETALQAVLARWPEQPDALHFLGVLRHTQGRHDEAVALVQRALAKLPSQAGAWNNLGNILLGARRLDDAAQAYEQSVALTRNTPDSAGALNNLSVIHRKRGRWAEAEAACRAALQVRPDSGDSWFNLSLALMGQGQVHEGLIANSRAIALWPRLLQARNEVIRALLMLGERERAATLYREWLAEDPDNPVVQHQLAACLGEHTPARASNGYIEQVFDTFADSFDVKLEALHYVAPQRLAQAVQQRLGEPQAALDIADLGCGTGLCGPLLRPYARQLVGCDLSVGMLRKAKPRQVYDTLHRAELVYYLDTQPAAFDVLASADTFIYFGVLDDAMAAAARALRPGGRLFFTVEALDDSDDAPHRLQTNGRYAHHRCYLQATLATAGFGAVEIEPFTVRHEAGKPVPGWVVSAQQAPCDS
ncbi:tetratricopeptide repeat protein [Aquabacterium sp.]|uniref:tetratricopeptide repeat protein n=1 Tax=Aquabacterium sp. TaxID=1872578 RepID=UPI002CE0049C|nr:tetratricopeptide repeat protein [Aquabacterium sp.]HSW08720.1 tetratricopeptide repeat protein [Aquabacterium sp.]